MKKNLFFLAILLYGLKGYCQANYLSPHIYYKSINELGIGIEYQYGTYSLQASLGCYIPLKNNVPYFKHILGEDVISPFQMIGQFGPTLELKNLFNTNDEFKNVYFGFVLDGSYLKSTKFISDPDNSRNYTEFYDKMWMIGFGPVLHYRISDQTPFFLTIESGVNLKFIDRHYVVKTTAFGIIPDDKIASINAGYFFLRFGFIYIFNDTNILKY